MDGRLLPLAARVPAAGVTSGIAPVAAHVRGVTSKLGVVSGVSGVPVSRVVAVHGGGGGGELVLVRRRISESSHRPPSTTLAVRYSFIFLFRLFVCSPLSKHLPLRKSRVSKAARQREVTPRGHRLVHTVRALAVCERIETT